MTGDSGRVNTRVFPPPVGASTHPNMAMSGAHLPRWAWLSLHWAMSGCGDPVRHEDRASPHARSQGHRPASPVQVDAQTRVVRPRPRQILLERGGSPSIRWSGRAGAPVPLAHSGRRRRSTPAPPRVRARRRPRIRQGAPCSPGTGRWSPSRQWPRPRTQSRSGGEPA
jgi:hypothetical protein